MGVKITKQLKFLSLIERSTEDFKKNVNQTVAPEVLKTIEGGNNPVKVGKQVKYSESYLEQITGKKRVKYTDKNGKEKIKYGRAINTRDTSIGANSSIKTGKVTRSLQSRYGKRPSPVNLTLTGKLIASFKTMFTERGVRLTFTDPKADWHNEGVPSKNIPPRRLLPNHEGEAFNFNISRRILDALKRALKLNL